jgi:thymidylate synthase
MGSMNSLDKQYQELLQDILDNGVRKGDRTGTGTISVFGRMIRHKMSEGFPLLTTKKMYFKGIVTELIWFLRGDTNIKYLVDNNCHIWDGDAYKRFSQIRKSMLMLKPPASEDKLREYIEWYEQVTTQEEFIDKIKTDDEFAKTWGELGPIYGAQWRSWRVGEGIATTLTDREGETIYEAASQYIDQLGDAIQLLKTDPDSRRNRVSAWNVGEIKNMVLPPCHTDFQFYTRELSFDEREKLFYKNRTVILTKNEKLTEEDFDNVDIPKRAISLMWNQRSVDTFLGLPFNIASYGLLLEIVATVVNMVPDELIGTLGDVHLYLNHIEQAKEQIGREFTEEEILEHLQQSGMDALRHEPRMEYISKLPKRTREHFPLPKLNINTEFWLTEGGECGIGPLSVEGFISGLNDNHFCKCLMEEDIQLEDYKSHPAIKAPLSN